MNIPKNFAQGFETFRLANQILWKLFQTLPQFIHRLPLILKSTDQIGVGSLPIITLATAFTGLVMTHEIAWHMDFALSNVSMIPGFTGQFVLRELGIVVPAFLIVSKVGASLTAELASMKITEQLDAYRLLKIDLLSYHIFPRWIACIGSTVCLTLISIAITLLVAMLTAVTRYHFNAVEYMNTLSQFVQGLDLACAVVKSTVFGAVIPPIACAYGIRCSGGAQGVGQATTDAVVACTLTIIVLDFVLTAFFSASLSI